MGVPSEVPVGKLVYTVFNSILEVFLTCLAGYILARRRILDKKTQKKLNHLNVSLFTPALVFSKVAFFLTPQKLLSLWIIPISFIIITLVSLIVSLLLSLPFKLRRSQRNFAIAASMFMNSNSLPIALMQSLVGSVPGLKWERNGGGEDNMDAMMGRALTYLVVASTMGMVLRWSFGVRLLAAADEPEPCVKPTPTKPLASEPHSPTVDQFPLASSSSTIVSLTPFTSRSPSFEKPRADNTTDSSAHLRPPHLRTSMACYRSFPNSPTQAFQSLPPSEAPSRRGSVVSLTLPGVGRKDEESGLSGPLPESDSKAPAPPSTPESPSLVHRMLHSMARKLRSFYNAISPMLTPPLIASLISLLIALITPVQHFLLKEELKPVRGMLEKVGAVSIPLTLIVLGGYFVPEVKDGEKSQGNGRSDAFVGNVKAFFVRRKKARKKDDEESGASVAIVSPPQLISGEPSQPADNTFPTFQTEKQDESPGRKGENTTVIISIVSRMILVPAVLMPLVVWIATSDWAGVFDDPIFILSLLLLLCSPPALTLAQITQAASGDAFERLISRTIFWSYLVMTPLVMVGVVVGGVVLAKV